MDRSGGRTLPRRPRASGAARLDRGAVGVRGRRAVRGRGGPPGALRGDRALSARALAGAPAPRRADVDRARAAARVRGLDRSRTLARGGADPEGVAAVAAVALERVRDPWVGASISGGDATARGKAEFSPT